MRFIAFVLLMLFSLSLQGQSTPGGPAAASQSSQSQTLLTPAEFYLSATAKAIGQSQIARLAVQSEGVETSLLTFAEIQVNAITGRTRFSRMDPLYTVLSMIYQPELWNRVALFPVENPQLARQLGLDPDQHHRLSLAWIMSHPAAQQLVFSQEGAPSASSEDAQALQKLRSRIASFINLPAELRLIPLPDTQGRWVSPVELQKPELAESPALGSLLRTLDTKTDPYKSALQLDQALRQAFAATPADQASPELTPQVASLLSAFAKTPNYVSSSQRELDYFNTSFRPLQRSAQLHLIALFAFLIYLFRLRRNVTAPQAAVAYPPVSRRGWVVSFGLSCLAALVLVTGLIIRLILTGRMPVANMYESVVFALGGFVIAALVFEGIYRQGWIGAIGACLGWALMTMANGMPLHLRKVEPLVAVLNSGWLNFHVTTLMLSYSLFLLAFAFGVLYFWKDFSGNRVGVLPHSETFEYMTYRAIQVAWPLLTVGIVLGAIWANTAWGRYWSWDPKETWSLITWLTYTVYLHLRMNAGWKGRRSVAASMLGFAMVLVTYFGVSYLAIFAGGKHTYASPTP